MFLFGGPNIRKMAEERDYDGLVSLLDNRSPQTRLEAAEALAQLNDGRGWRYLLDAVRDNTDPLIQAATAEVLAGLGHPRAIPVLQEAALRARREALDAIHEALEVLGSAGGPIAPTGERFPGPVIEEPDPGIRGLVGSLASATGGSLEGEFVEPAKPSAASFGQIEVRSAEVHLNTAVDLREAEFQERALVEISLALWLRPEWAEAWYVRGVLLEDLEREREALAAYRQALELDPTHQAANEALAELSESVEPLPPDLGVLVPELHDSSWRQRRDAAAALGELAAHLQADSGFRLDPAALLEAAHDEEREVRHAAIEAIGRAHLTAAAPTLAEQSESSWLLRFAVLAALSDLGAVNPLVDRLRNEMGGLQERNAIYTSNKDPMLALEYDLLLEVGLLALERTGDVAALLDQAEGNVWQDVEVEDDEEDFAEDDTGSAELSDADDGYTLEEDEEDLEADEDLLSYVDETGLMVAQALERIAARQLSRLSPDLLRRLAETPDLTLIDLSEEGSGAPTTVHDFTALRAQAAAELKRRG